MTKLKATLLMPFGAERARDSSPGDPGERTTRPGIVLPAADPMPRVGDVVGGHYRLVRTLGEGMFGQVYVAERTDVPEHRVALKVLSRDMYAGRNVERELVMLAAASHPHIVQLKDHGMTEHYVWISMPLYEGETLDERLERGTLSLREAYDIFVPIARGVHALHERGLRHQDVKPENIYLARFGGRLHPVLLDLGVAVEKNAEFVAGTALYAAPEQLAALAGMTPATKLGERIDSYCLAATLLYALVGERHYPGADALTPFAVANAFEERETAPLRRAALPELSGEPRQQLAEALSRWLVRDPAVRPSVETIADELEVLLAQEREAARIIEEGIARQKLALRRVRVALGAVALAAAGAAAWGLTKRETLQLAAELERVRAQGAASFDQLDTCVAAHELSREQARACSDARERERDAHREALARAAIAKQAAVEALQGKLGGEAAKLRACQAEHERAETSWEQARAELERALTDEKARLGETEDRLAAEKSRAADLERRLGEQQKTAKTCEANLATLTDSRAQCREDLASCIEHRDTCLHLEPSVAGPAADKPSGPGSGDPASPSAPQG